MVDLTLERPGEHLFVRSVTTEGVQVVDQWYSGSVVIGPQRVLEDWAPDGFAQLDAAHFSPILEFDPEVVIIGTGERQRFLPPELMMEFLGQGIGAEVMSTPAACRTFNVLVSEGRRVVAALLPPGS